MIIRILNKIRYYCQSHAIKDKMKYLCVAEKNDAAKTISGFLSRGQSQRREGFSPFNKIYEFNYNYNGSIAHIVFTSVSGHLLNHDFVGTFRKWQGCSPEQLFDAPIVKFCPENYGNIKRTLEREIRTCYGLIIFTDCDREGENIGFEIIEVCRAIKPNINVQRAKFSDMTAASLTRAMNNLCLPDERISNAVDVRSELDLRIGAAFTRYQTMRLQALFPDDVENDLVSYGSCQIPTLGFVAERYREIERFVPNTFWKIKLTHKMNDLTVEYNWARNRLFDKACCEAILMLCKAENQAIITNVQQKPKNKWRPQPMDTIELEKTGSRKLRMSAKEIMTIAEKLYTKGFISYPRTETNQFSKDIKLRPLVEMQAQDPDWGGFANRVLQWGPNPRNGNKSDQAHPPIHPTKYATGLNGNEKRVYELVVRHFLACVSKDAIGTETIVNATIGGEEFNANGLVILERNYLDVYIYEKWSGKEIHNYEIGFAFVPTVLDLHEGATSPPALLTEADLIALMEKHGIGTDATHADHIATVKERGYIGVKDRGQLVPGTLGMGLVEGYEQMNLHLAQPQLRAGLEVDLKAICEGTKFPQEVLRNQIEIYKQCYQTITQQVEKLDRAVGHRYGKEPLRNAGPIIARNYELFKCIKCKTHSMIVKQKRDNSGAFIGCQGFPTCSNSIWLQNIKSISSLDEKCTSCGGENHKVVIKFSQNYMLGMTDEVPAYSRIQGSTYITCIFCDSKVREVLQIKTEDIKVLGNIVGANSRPVHQNQPTVRTMFENYNNNNNSGQTTRRFGTSSNNNQNQNQGSGSFSNNNNHSDIASGSNDSRNNFNNNQNQNQGRGWFNNSNDNRPSSSGSNDSRGYQNSFNNNQNQNQGRGWFSNDNNDSGVVSGSNDSRNNFNNNQNQGRGWFNNSDDNRPSSSGANNNTWGNQNNSTSNNYNNQNQRRGWFDNDNSDDNRPSSSGAAGTNNNSKSNWDALNKNRQILSKLPNAFCFCKKVALKLMCRKEGPNVNRPFYKCNHGTCKFFHWADSPLPSIHQQPRTVNQGSSSNYPNNQNSSSSNNPGPSGDGLRRCSLCRMAGHNKKNCPSKTN